MIIDIHSDFKSLNPVLSTSEGISNLYEHYSSDITIASKIMWSIFMLDYPDKDINSKAKLPYSDRVEDITLSYFKDFKALINDNDNTLIKEAVKSFRKYCLSFKENMFRIQRAKLDEMTLFFEQLELKDDGDFDKYMKLSDKIGKIWDNFDRVEKQYIKAKDDNLNKQGGGNLSLAEQRRNR